MKVLRCEWARDCDERYGETASTTLCFHPPFLKSLSLTACAVLPCLVVLLFQVGFVGCGFWASRNNGGILDLSPINLWQGPVSLSVRALCVLEHLSTG